MFGPELPLDNLHLVFQPQFQFFQPDFLQLFVFGEKSFLGKGIEALRILRVFIGQLAKLVVTYEELVSRTKHPSNLRNRDYFVNLPHDLPCINPKFCNWRKMYTFSNIPLMHNRMCNLHEIY